MPKLIDLTGQTFNRLTVIERDMSAKTAKAKWWCRCECGQIVSVDGCHLRNGHTKSCGCLQKEKAAISMKEFAQPQGAKAVEKDLTGQNFGLLTVVGLVADKKGDKK